MIFTIYKIYYIIVIQIITNYYKLLQINKNMRNIINISMPKEMKDFINKEIEEKQYSSVSEFFRMLIRNYKEEELLKILQKSKNTIKNTKKITSLKELR